MDASQNVTQTITNSTTIVEVETILEDVFMEKVKTFTAFKIATLINTYWFAFLVPLGLVGNILSFLVMMTPNNRKMSTCIYMAAISVNDNIMMCKALHYWLVTVMKVHKLHPVECRIASFWALFGLQNSTFQVLAMTVDKYVAIKWPHKAATYSTPKRAKAIVIIIFLCLIIYNIPHLFIARVIGGQCFGYSAGGVITKVYSWISFVFNGIIPFTLLLHMNSVIVKAVGDSRRMFGTKDMYSEGMRSRNKTMRNAENQLTIMLLLVTTWFFILLIPTYIRFVFMTFFQPNTPYKFSITMLVFQITHKLYHTNNGINFFLYCISGRKFRNDLKQILCCTGSSSGGSCNESSTKVTVPISSLDIKCH